MDKIQLLKARKEKLVQAGGKIREQIKSLIDEDSFVELSAFCFSKNDFYGEDADGEGVVTGFATIDDYPYYVVAQNYDVKKGGLSNANCDKIVKCLDQAEKNTTPVIYLLNCTGVQVGEGATVLDGMAKLLLRVTQLRGVVPQYAVVNGDVFGSVALIASACDFTFFTNNGVLSVNSPVVLSAKAGKNLAKEEVGGANALNDANVVSFTVNGLDEVKSKIKEINGILAGTETEVDLNDSLPALNEKADDKNILSVIENAVEIGAGYEQDVKTVLGRIGGIPVAAVVFAGEEGVEIDERKMKKIKNFAELACWYSVPFVTFVNTLGVKPTMEVNNSTVMKEIAEYMAMLDAMDTAKIAVVYKKAIGLGYSLFAAKGMGFDYTVAFANAKIALFDSVQGAEIEFGKSDEKLAEKYADENSDPVNMAKDGAIDDVIEPQFVKQYIIASLQMLLN